MRCERLRLSPRRPTQRGRQTERKNPNLIERERDAVEAGDGVDQVVRLVDDDDLAGQVDAQGQPCTLVQEHLVGQANDLGVCHQCARGIVRAARVPLAQPRRVFNVHNRVLDVRRRVAPVVRSVVRTRAHGVGV